MFAVDEARHMETPRDNVPFLEKHALALFVVVIVFFLGLELLPTIIDSAAQTLARRNLPRVDSQITDMSARIKAAIRSTYPTFCLKPGYNFDVHPSSDKESRLWYVRCIPADQRWGVPFVTIDPATCEVWNLPPM